MNRRSALLALAALSLPLALASCSDGGEVTIKTPSTTSSNPTTSETSASPSTDSTSTSSSSDARSSFSSSTTSGKGATILTFGQTFTFKNGIELTVSKPSDYTPGEYSSAKGKYPKFAKFTFVLANKSSSPVKGYQVRTSATAGNTATAEVFGSGLGAPSASVLPGKTITWNSAYGYKPGDELILEVGQSWDYEDESKAFFSGTL